MNKEIQEAINNLNGVVKGIYRMDEAGLEIEDIEIILNCITNLQKENEELKKLITELNSKVMLKDKQIKEALRIIEEKCGEYDIPDELEKILKEDE